MRLPTWMRGALIATATMNFLATVAFVPPGSALRAIAGFPEGGHPFYMATVGMFVLLFGGAYLYAGVTGRPDRLFIGVAAIGKISFVALVSCFWAAGTLPPRAPVTAMGDLFFGVLFLRWLARTRAESRLGIEPTATVAALHRP
jgi:hypothetical protein